jgi:hypothetical protein
LGEIALGRWKVDPVKLDMVIDGDRISLIGKLFQEKVNDLLSRRDTVLVYFEEMGDVFYLNMFRDEVRYYGRRRNQDLSVEVPFLCSMDTNKLKLSVEAHFLNHLNMNKKERIPIPLSKVHLIDVLDEMKFEKTQNIYILRNDAKKRKQKQPG